MKGFEADDIIGTVAKKASKEKYETFMVTPDKDYAQLVNDNTYMLKPARGGKEEEIITRNDVIEQWNINHIHQVIDILGLAGDSVDNIPGIPGIGPENSSKINFFQYGSIENMIKNVEKLKGKQKENVENFKDDALISKELATIKCDVPIDFSLENLIQGKINDEKLKEILISLEFSTFLKRIFEKMSMSEDENFSLKINKLITILIIQNIIIRLYQLKNECRLLAKDVKFQRSSY